MQVHAPYYVVLCGLSVGTIFPKLYDFLEKNLLKIKRVL
jgi:hypothetical protein